MRFYVHSASEGSTVYWVRRRNAGDWEWKQFDAKRRHRSSVTTFSYGPGDTDPIPEWYQSTHPVQKFVWCHEGVSYTIEKRATDGWWTTRTGASVPFRKHVVSCAISIHFPIVSRVVTLKCLVHCALYTVLRENIVQSIVH